MYWDIHRNVIMKLYRYLKPTKMSFFSTTEDRKVGQEGKTGPI
jgi:hypothetical protein